MPYCPIKTLASRIAGASSSSPTSGIPMMRVAGVYDAADECDKEACGFWSTQAGSCGLAAIGTIPIKAADIPT